MVSVMVSRTEGMIEQITPYCINTVVSFPFALISDTPTPLWASFMSSFAYPLMKLPLLSSVFRAGCRTRTCDAIVQT